ncbi:hypothetical protein [Pectinatus cerevisiiphilus]|uniref:Uncharacterized protein n=1 Tax=Pectinatus cerevisiiphilus TaxID=86956 RepID=A0A4R3KFH4_9FIRM|nr:hypothetical protein [Pectinatus cerevisiiphilus]TCS82047.1 hypothetical protein EDC37_101219 [Pectinatus cerevisiiphilus]
MYIKRTLIALVVFLLSLTTAVQTTQAFSLGSILGDALKVGGISVLVDKFAVPLNSAINTLLTQHGMGTSYATKVVPIISIGDGSYVGAAQVTGPQDGINQTQAVLQLEGNFSDSRFRLKGLIPVNAKSVTNISRVQGVGVSAQIDVKI